MYVGRKPTHLSEADGTHASLMLNAVFNCPTRVTQVSYYRTSPYEPVFVGIWREIGYRVFTLLHKITLPPAPIGLTVVELDRPIDAERGDFIGVHYNSNAEESPLAVATSENFDAVPQNELFEALVVPLYDEFLRVDQSVNVEDLYTISVRKTYALELSSMVKNITGKYWTTA